MFQGQGMSMKTQSVQCPFYLIPTKDPAITYSFSLFVLIGIMKIKRLE